MTAPTLPAANREPIPMGDAELNALVEDLRTAQRLADEYNDAVDRKKQALIDLVDRYGAMPPKAERSRRLVSDRFMLTVSRSESVTIDVTRVGILYSRLRAAGCAALFKKLFRAEQKYSIAAGAREFAAGKLPAKAPRNLRQLFHACIGGKTNNPKLDIVDLAARAEKKAKSQKGGARMKHGHWGAVARTAIRKDLPL